MNQEKAREALEATIRARWDLSNHAVDYFTRMSGREPTEHETDMLIDGVNAVLSADPRVIAEAMGGRMVLMHCAHRDVPEQWAILLPPGKVEP